MIGNKKLKKLKDDLHELNITHEMIAENLEISRPTVAALLTGAKYDAGHISAMIKMRDIEKKKAQELASAI